MPPVEETPTEETIGQDAEPTTQAQTLDETSTGTSAIATGFAIGTVCICALLYSFTIAQQQCAEVGKDHFFVVVMYRLAFCFKSIQMYFQLNKYIFFYFNSQKHLRKNYLKTT